MGNCLLFALLSAYIIVIHVRAQDPSGFISLDCGLSETNGYHDPITSLYYSSDEAYIDTGIGSSISPEFKSKSISPIFNNKTIPKQFYNVRSFPGVQGTRSCYTLKPKLGKGYKYLIRASFIYGNYDDQNKVPQFDLHLGVDFWDTCTLTSSSFKFETEILHLLSSDYVSICLVNTGFGTPFISVLEVRPIKRALYVTTSGSLKLYARWDLGSTRNYFLRFKEDPYDRQWKRFTLANSTILTNTFDSFPNNYPGIPSRVMNTAVQAPTVDGFLNITWDTGHPTDQFYMFLHVTEHVKNASREMIINVNDGSWKRGPFIPPYQTVLTLFNVDAATGSLSYEMLINSTKNSNLPPMINAIELYIVKHFSHYGTDDNDVAALMSIKKTYGITKNWQGDPCSPKGFTWFGINCTNRGFEPPKVLSLNLSSDGLTGTVDTSISNLTTLQSLDLSYNNLTGQVPEFLSWLPSLKYLNIKGNNFTGSLPLDILNKSKNGSLVLSYETQSNSTSPCENDTCNEKNNHDFIVLVSASVGAVFIILVLSVLLWRKWKEFSNFFISFMRGVRNEPNQKYDSFLKKKLPRLSFSEVNCIIDKNTILGRGSFGTVYHGHMDGIQVAVKMLNLFPDQPDQGYKDFQNEVNILATVNHKNLASLLGYCDEGTNKCIICEFVGNGNLAKHLWGDNILSWELRIGIMIDAAEGLAYLHHGCKPSVIHRDIKPTNILLTENFEAKLADFGMSKTCPVGSTRLAGTPGYFDPQYQQNPHILSEKIDVYSFGVVMLVIVTGQYAIINHHTHISQWVSHKIEKGDIKGIVDTRLLEDFDVNSAWKVVELAMACVSLDSLNRPSMNSVVKELKECSLSKPNQHEKISATGITLTPSNMRSIFRPHTR